jgi:hypothetical protein
LPQLIVDQMSGHSCSPLAVNRYPLASFVSTRCSTRNASRSGGTALGTPSSAFGSLGIADVTKVGESLDRKVANLLRVIGVDADQAFGAE